jgi:hypothetical protein
MSGAVNGRAEAAVVGLCAGFLFLIMLGLLALSDGQDQAIAPPMVSVAHGQVL